MMDVNTISYLFWENLLFVIGATGFIFIVDKAWKDLKPYELPKLLPKWFTYWLRTILIFCLFLPIAALILWGLVWGYKSVIIVILPYLLILGLQIVSEIYTLRQMQSVVWVMVPFIYVPYRVWQLYEGLNFLSTDPNLIWVRYLLIINLVLWIVNYFLLNIAQLPKLFHWPSSSV